jgi:hypothetical protein
MRAACDDPPRQATQRCSVIRSQKQRRHTQSPQHRTRLGDVVGEDRVLGQHQLQRLASPAIDPERTHGTMHDGPRTRLPRAPQRMSTTSGDSNARDQRAVVPLDVRKGAEAVHLGLPQHIWVIEQLGDAEQAHGGERGHCVIQ